jgi:hypothetical protein
MQIKKKKNFMERSPCETDSHVASQEILSLFGT